MPEHFSKFAIFTAFGEGLPLAHHLMEEGAEVLVGMVFDVEDAMEKENEEPDAKKIRWSAYEGILDKVDAWELLEKMSGFENKDEWCVIFDFNTLWKFAAVAQKNGFKYGLFPSRLDYTMESDRDLAKRFVQKNYPDLKVAEVEQFKTQEEGIEFLNNNDDFWALKGNNAEAKTVVPSSTNLDFSNSEIEDALEANKKDYESKGYIFERQIRDGVEVCPQMIWMDGVRVASCIDLEDKRFSPNVGSSMEGCAINAIVQTPIDCELNRIAFPPAADALAKKHKGLFYLDANLIIKDGEAYYLEFCSNRMGFDAIFAEVDMAGGVMDYFNALLHGLNPYDSFYGVGVRGFSTKRNGDGTLKEGLRIQYEDSDHLWHYSIQKDGDKMLNTGGSFGNPVGGIDLVAFTESSDDMDYAIQKLYGVVDEYSFPGLYVRRDCDALRSRLPELEKLISPPESETGK